MKNQAGLRKERLKPITIYRTEGTTEHLIQDSHITDYGST
jgi:hypothetical protein